MRSSRLSAFILAPPQIVLALSRSECQTACNANLGVSELSALYYQTTSLQIQTIDLPHMNEICITSSNNIDKCSQCTLSGHGLSVEGDRIRLSAWQATCQTWEYTSPEQALDCWKGWPDDTSSCWEDGIIEFPEVVHKDDPARQERIPIHIAGAAAPASSSGPQTTGAPAVRTTTYQTVVVVPKEKSSARPSRMEDGNKVKADTHTTTNDNARAAIASSASSSTEYASLAICFSLFAFLALWPPQALKVDRVFQSC